MPEPLSDVACVANVPALPPRVAMPFLPAVIEDAEMDVPEDEVEGDEVPADAEAVCSIPK